MYTTVDGSVGKVQVLHPKDALLESCCVLIFILRHLLNINLEMFLAIARKLNLENIRDIPLCPCGTSRYSTEIAEAFITVYTILHIQN